MSTSIPKRRLGKNGPMVPALGLGLMGLSTAYGPVGTDEERLKFLDRAYELGDRFWDSAPAYGDSEDLVGKWFKKTSKRSDIFMATKFAFGTTFSDKLDSSPEAVREECERSLQRMGTDYIDLLYCELQCTLLIILIM
jgi:aryl-alcohol dehydrogenase-like predicted oxidoreductase